MPDSSPEWERFGFDAQAGVYDRRTGLPEDVARAVARNLGTLLRAPDWLLEVGAGTGTIGTSIVDAQHRYIGLDLSLPMLSTFREKLGSSSSNLVQADADQAWPIAAGSIRVLFFSRSAHLLRSAHVIEEALRVGCEDGFSLVLGRVRRGRENLRSQMRARMRELLAEHGVEGRAGDQARKRLLEGLVERGGSLSEALEAAAWRVCERPKDAIDSWRDKDGLAGKDVPVAAKRDVLEKLSSWAEARFGKLDSRVESTESYELSAVQFPPG